MLVILILSLISARLCQHGVIGSLEKFFQWYGSLIATHPKKAILISVLITTLGGLGLFRYKKELSERYFLFLQCILMDLGSQGSWVYALKILLSITFSQILWRGRCCLYGHSKTFTISKKYGLARLKLSKRGIRKINKLNLFFLKINWDCILYHLYRNIFFTSSQIRTHSILYEADNVLTPEVIQAMYKQRKLLQNLKNGNKSFQVNISFKHINDLDC